MNAPSVAELRAAAAAAQRLAADPYLRETLDEMVTGAAELAINHPDPATREENRQLVLAVGRLRNTLQNVWESWQLAITAPADNAKWE